MAPQLAQARVAAVAFLLNWAVMFCGVVQIFQIRAGARRCPCTDLVDLHGFGPRSANSCHGFDTCADFIRQLRC